MSYGNFKSNHVFKNVLVFPNTVLLFEQKHCLFFSLFHIFKWWNSCMKAHNLFFFSIMSVDVEL